MKYWNQKNLCLAFSLLGIVSLGACSKSVATDALASANLADDSGTEGTAPVTPDQGVTGGETSAPTPVPPVVTTPPETPAPTPAATTTCYRYAFVSGIDQNVFLSDTCSDTLPRRITSNDDSRTSFANLTFKGNGDSLVFDRFERTVDGFRVQSLTAELGGNSSLIQENTAALFQATTGDYEPKDLAFEPNGARTAFLTQNEYVVLNQDDLVKLDAINLFDPAHPAVGGAPTVFEANADQKIQRVVWRPNHNQLVFPMKTGSGPNQLYSMNLATAHVEPLPGSLNPSFLPVGVQGSEPAFHPAGKTLAFVRKVDGQNQIFTCNFERPFSIPTAVEICGSIRQRTFEGDNTDPAWTPDGLFLFFTTNRNGNKDLYRMRGDGSEVTPVRQNLADESRVAIHPVPFTI